jgi:hypothetical protein
VTVLGRSLRALLARLREVDAEREELSPREDGKLVGLLLVAAFGLAMVFYFGTRVKVRKVEPLLDALFGEGTWTSVFRHPELGTLFKDAWWVACILVFYGALPLLYARLVAPRWSFADVGLSARRALAHWKIYAALYALMLVPVGLAALRGNFIAYYPINKTAVASLERFALWELIYLSQFFAVEVLFRGLLILPFRRRLGSYAILLPLLPYCMVHFGKPMPEALAALVAGLVLGTLALLTRTVWLGVAIHASVALTMDVLGIVMRGGFTGR